MPLRGWPTHSCCCVQGWEEGDGAFLAPELLQVGVEPSTAADIFSLGATLYQCATGNMLQRQEGPGPAQAPLPERPPAFQQLVRSMLQPTPEGRPLASQILQFIQVQQGGEEEQGTEEGAEMPLELRGSALQPPPSPFESTVPAGGAADKAGGQEEEPQEEQEQALPANFSFDVPQRAPGRGTTTPLGPWNQQRWAPDLSPIIGGLTPTGSTPQLGVTPQLGSGSAAAAAPAEARNAQQRRPPPLQLPPSMTAGELGRSGALDGRDNTWLRRRDTMSPESDLLQGSQSESEGYSGYTTSCTHTISDLEFADCVMSPLSPGKKVEGQWVLCLALRWGCPACLAWVLELIPSPCPPCRPDVRWSHAGRLGVLRWHASRPHPQICDSRPFQPQHRRPSPSSPASCGAAGSMSGSCACAGTLAGLGPAHQPRVPHAAAPWLGFSCGQRIWHGQHCRWALHLWPGCCQSQPGSCCARALHVPPALNAATARPPSLLTSVLAPPCPADCNPIGRSLSSVRQKLLDSIQGLGQQLDDAPHLPRHDSLAGMAGQPLSSRFDAPPATLMRQGLLRKRQHSSRRQLIEMLSRDASCASSLDLQPALKTTRASGPQRETDMPADKDPDDTTDDHGEHFFSVFPDGLPGVPERACAPSPLCAPMTSLKLR